jgi:Asp/Glu/hydantoin racemase
VLILAGAPIAGLAETIAADVPAILVDPVQAAVLQAVALFRLRPQGADLGSFARPPGKPGTGLPTALASWFGRGI